jgi:hypothetical protein
VLQNTEPLKAQAFHSEELQRRVLWIFQVSGFNFNTWEFPKVRIYNAGRPLPQQQATALLPNKRNESARRGPNPRRRIWKPIDTILLISGAEFCHRTNTALRLPGRADECAEFHESLVEPGTKACSVELIPCATVPGWMRRMLPDTRTSSGGNQHKLLGHAPEFGICF